MLIADHVNLSFRNPLTGGVLPATSGSPTCPSRTTGLRSTRAAVARDRQVAAGRRRVRRAPRSQLRDPRRGADAGAARRGCGRDVHGGRGHRRPGARHALHRACPPSRTSRPASVPRGSPMPRSWRRPNGCAGRSPRWSRALWRGSRWGAAPVTDAVRRGMRTALIGLCVNAGLAVIKIAAGVAALAGPHRRRHRIHRRPVLVAGGLERAPDRFPIGGRAVSLRLRQGRGASPWRSECCFFSRPSPSPSIRAPDSHAPSNASRVHPLVLVGVIMVRNSGSAGSAGWARTSAAPWFRRTPGTTAPMPSPQPRRSSASRSR